MILKKENGCRNIKSTTKKSKKESIVHGNVHNQMLRHSAAAAAAKSLQSCATP